MEATDKKLLDQVRDAIRLKHYSIRTEEAYTNWIKRYIYFHNAPLPAEITTASLATIAANDDNLPPRECPVRHRHTRANPVLAVQIRSCMMESVS